MKTITSLLFADEAAGRSQLESKLGTLPAAQTVLAWPGVLAAMASDILAFFRIPVGDFAASAYQKYDLIEDARRETAESLGRQVVELMSHEIDHKIEPEVEIELNGVRQTLFNLELKVKLAVESVTAVVDSGRMTDIAPGSATASLSLSAGGVELAKAETQPVDLALPDKTRVVVDVTAMGEPIVDQFPVGRAQGTAPGHTESTS